MITPKPILLLNEITDIYVRRNFQNLYDYFKENNQLVDFKFFEMEFKEAVTDKKILHGFNYIPKDIIVTMIAGEGDVTFNVGSFNNKEIILSASGPCVIRFFIGLYWKSEKQAEISKDTKVTYSGNTSINGSTAVTKSYVAGSVIPYVGSDLPDGDIALWCDGKSYDAKKYPALAKALWDVSTKKYKYGGTGTYPQGTFNTPDTRGVVLRGHAGDSARDPDKALRTASGTGGNTGNAVGSFQGHSFQSHTHTQASHNHWMFNSGAATNGTMGSSSYCGVYRQGGHVFNYSDYYLTGSKGNAYPNVGLTSTEAGTTAAASGTGSTAQATSTETRMINISINYIIMI